MTINIVVDIDVVPGKLDFVSQVLKEMIQETAHEEGSLRFEAHVYEDEKDRILLIEEWADQDAIDFHMGTVYTKDFIEKVDGLFVQPPTVRRVQPITRGERYGA